MLIVVSHKFIDSVIAWNISVRSTFLPILYKPTNSFLVQCSCSKSDDKYSTSGLPARFSSKNYCEMDRRCKGLFEH